jgi:chromosome segregation ATPase
MKQTIATTVLFGLLVLQAFVKTTQAQTAAPANETECVAALRQELAAELRKLRLELAEQSMEFQQWKIKQLERDLEQVNSEQQRLLLEENSLQQEIAELAKQPDNLPSEPGQTSGLELVKTQLNEHELPRLRTARSKLDQRIFELTEQLRREEARQRDLQQQAKRLQTEK